MALLFWKDETYSDVCINACIKDSLSLNGVISNAFCFPISVLQIVEMVSRTVGNCKSCNVFSVMDIILLSKLLNVKVTKIQK